MAEDNSRRKWNPHAGPYLGEVSSLAFLNLPQDVTSIPYLLAGSGSEILLYDLSSGELIRSFLVFEGVRVHGTVCSSSFVRSEDRYTYKLVIFGEKRVKIFSLIVESASSNGEISVNLEMLDSLPRLYDWVFDVCFLQDHRKKKTNFELLDVVIILSAFGILQNHVWLLKSSHQKGVYCILCDHGATLFRRSASLLALFSMRSLFGGQLALMVTTWTMGIIVLPICVDLFVMRDMLNRASISPELNMPSLNYFKAAHGISTVSSLSVTRLTSNKAEICSLINIRFDVASLVPLVSPVLSLHHATVPLHPPYEGNNNNNNNTSSGGGDVYLLISGATDGRVAFWDVTTCVEAFVKQALSLHFEKFIDCQKRARTGRGSQGGRKWKLLGANISKRSQDSSSNSVRRRSSHLFGTHKWRP